MDEQSGQKGHEEVIGIAGRRDVGAHCRWSMRKGGLGRWALFSTHGFDWSGDKSDCCRVTTLQECSMSLSSRSGGLVAMSVVRRAGFESQEVVRVVHLRGPDRPRATRPPIHHWVATATFGYNRGHKSPEWQRWLVCDTPELLRARNSESETTKSE